MKEPKAATFSVSDATSAFFEHLNDLKKWQEEQVQKLRFMQKTQLAQLQEEQMKMETLLKFNGDSQSKQNSASAQSIPLASHVAHTQHKQETQFSKLGNNKRETTEQQGCKKQTSQSAPIPQNISSASKGRDVSETEVKGLNTSFEEAIESHMEKLKIENAQSCNSDKSNEEHPKTVKRKFLKKGEGIKRFKPEKISYQRTGSGPATRRTKPILKTTNSSIKSKSAKENSKLEPYRQKLNTTRNPTTKKLGSSQKQNRCVQFAEPTVIKESYRPSSKSSNTVIREQKKSEEPKAVEESSAEDFIDRKMRESQELAEFEILEQHAENSSFSSDSSFLQSVISGEQGKNYSRKRAPFCSDVQKRNFAQHILRNKNIESCEQAHPRDNASGSTSGAEYIAKLLEEKKKLEMQLSNYRNVGVSLEMDPFISDNIIQPPYHVDLNTHHHADNESESGSTLSSICSLVGDDVNVATVAICGPNPMLVDAAVSCDILSSDSDVKSCSTEHPAEAFKSQENTGSSQNSGSGCNKSKIMEKLKELEEEISVYKDNNKHLTGLIKQKEDEIKALQKNRKDFDKFRAEEKAKIEQEITAQRMQIKREKQTFQRYRELSKNMPGRKEREEITVLRQQITKLQEDLKKQTLRSNAECKRLRKLLDDAERERDILKFENQRLEVQHEELIAALKACASQKCDCKMTAEKPRYRDYDAPVILDKDPKVKKVTDELIKSDDDEEENSELSSKKLDKTYGLIENNEDDFPEQDTSSTKQRVRFNLEPSIQNYNPDESSADYMEVKHIDRTERLYKNGETEVLFQSGTKKYISSDGLHIKFYFYNGDTKEIFPDKRVVYKFVDGTVETHLTNGMVQYEFPDGVLEKHYQDGRKFILLSDGTQTTIFPDGLEETRNSDGTVTKYLPDGTEIVEYPAGEKEIRSADYSQRIYADGTVRTVYKSGRMETRFPNGRIQIKDKNGRITVDTQHM